MAIDANIFRDNLSEAFIALLESKRGTAAKLAKAVGKPSSFINEVKRGKPVNSIHLKAVGMVFGPDKVLELLSLKDVHSGIVESDTKEHSHTVIEHQNIILQFKDPELGKTINEQLIVIQDEGGIFNGIVSSIKSAFETVIAIKRSKSQHYTEPKMENMDKLYDQEKANRREGGQKRRRSGEKEE